MKSRKPSTAGQVMTKGLKVTFQENMQISERLIIMIFQGRNLWQPDIISNKVLGLLKTN